MLAGWKPWKWMVCGWASLFLKTTRSRSPSRARRVGPGTCPLYAHAGYITPGATSISASSATNSYSLTVLPPSTRSSPQ